MKGKLLCLLAGDGGILRAWGKEGDSSSREEGRRSSTSLELCCIYMYLFNVTFMDFLKLFLQSDLLFLRNFSLRLFAAGVKLFPMDSEGERWCFSSLKGAALVHEDSFIMGGFSMFFITSCHVKYN